MKTKIQRDLKLSFLLFLWLLLGQFVVSALSTIISMSALALGAFGVISLVGRTPLWVWIVGSVLICLFWLAMGRFAPHSVRPEPVGAAAVLTMWAVLTSLMCTIHLFFLFFLPQEFCGGLLEHILLLWGCGFWTAKELGITIACFLLSAVVGLGLYLGRKNPSEADHDGERR